MKVREQIMKALNEAVADHRWNDAYMFLPLAVIVGYPSLSSTYIWKMTHLIVSKIKGCAGVSMEILTEAAYKYGLMRPEEICINQLAMLLSNPDNNQLQSSLDTYEKHRKLNQGYIGIKKLNPDEKHINALLKAYQGLISYIKYKNCCQGISSDYDSNTLEEQRLLLSQTLSLLQSAYKQLNGPCDWLMEPYLDCVAIDQGLDQALEMLDEYVVKHSTSATTYIFYYKYLKLVSKSDDKQIHALEKISKLWPNHPLVLEYVELLLSLTDSCNGRLDQSLVANEDSGLEDFSAEEDNNKMGDECRQESASSNDINSKTKDVNKQDQTFVYFKDCPLVNDLFKTTLMEAFKYICRLIEYPNWHHKLPAWEILTRIVTIYHRSWIRCWTCDGCKSTRSEIKDYIFTNFVPLWKSIFFTVSSNSPVLAGQKETALAMHRAYTAYVLMADEEFLDSIYSGLLEGSHSITYRQLMDMISFSSTYKNKFKEFLAEIRKEIKKLSSESTSQLKVSDLMTESIPNAIIPNQEDGGLTSDSELDNQSVLSQPVEEYGCISGDDEDRSVDFNDEEFITSTQQHGRNSKYTSVSRENGDSDDSEDLNVSSIDKNLSLLERLNQNPLHLNSTKNKDKPVESWTDSKSNNKSSAKLNSTASSFNDSAWNNSTINSNASEFVECSTSDESIDLSYSKLKCLDFLEQNCPTSNGKLLQKNNKGTLQNKRSIDINVINMCKTEKKESCDISKKRACSLSSDSLSLTEARRLKRPCIRDVRLTKSHVQVENNNNSNVREILDKIDLDKLIDEISDSD